MGPSVLQGLRGEGYSILLDEYEIDKEEDESA